MQNDIAGKLMSPEEAVRRFVSDGMQIAPGGFTVNRNPMVLAREIIRQKKRNYATLIGQALDLLIGAGCVQRLEIAYGGLGRCHLHGTRKTAFR